MMPSPRVSRRAALSTLAFAPVAGYLAGCSPEVESQGTIRRELTHVTNFGIFGRDAYAWVALPYLEAAGFNASVEPGDGTSGNLTLLESGEADFAAIDFSGLLMQHEKTAGKVLAFAAVQQIGLSSMMTFADSGIRTPRDLEGRTVGVPPGAVTDLLLPTWAEVAEFDLSTVEIVRIGGADIPAALAAGRVDAAGVFVVGQPAVQAHKPDEELLVIPYDEAFAGSMLGVALCARKETLENEPELCAAYRDAMLLGLRDALNEPGEAGRALNRHYPDVDRDVAAEEMELMRPYARGLLASDEDLGSMTHPQVSNSINLLRGTGAVTGNYDPEDFVFADMQPNWLP